MSPVVVGFVFLIFASNAHAQSPTCSQLQGVWRGQQTDAGGSARPITLTFRGDCSYTWVSPRTTTEGRVTISGASMGYRNAAGSIGDVTGNARSLTFRHWQNNYTVRISKQ